MKIIIGLLALLVSNVLYSQKIAESFKDAVDNRGISIEQLDENYKSALHSVV